MFISIRLVSLQELATWIADLWYKDNKERFIKKLQRHLNGEGRHRGRHHRTWSRGEFLSNWALGRGLAVRQVRSFSGPSLKSVRFSRIPCNKTEAAAEAEEHERTHRLKGREATLVVRLNILRGSPAPLTNCQANKL